MFKNYFTLALKVLRRKPFYTFISLFGISFTLMILMLITSMFDGMLGANAPLGNRDRLVFLSWVERLHYERDTVPLIDSIRMEDGSWRVDTTYGKTDVVNSNSTNAADYRFLNSQLSDVEGVERQALVSVNGHIDGYVEGRKFNLASNYTDGEYWKIFNFEFLEGAPFTPADVESANRVVVLTDRAAESYFGRLPDGYLDREILLGNQTFTVHGVVERPLSDNHLVTSDVWLPLTTSDDPKLLAMSPIAGPFEVVFLAETPAARENVIEDLAFIAENYQMPPEEEWFEEVRMRGYTYLQLFAGSIMREEDGDKAIRFLFIPIALLLLLFVTLPLINLINLNISRVAERESEIGVRKAFGAEPRDILYQFLFESLILTFIGGLIGILLAVLTILSVNDGELLGGIRLALSPSIFLYYFLVILLFGLLSGLLPAYRTSQTNVADALR